MNEENKDKQPKPNQEPKPSETPQAKPDTPQPKAENTEAKPKESPEKKTRPAECVACNKSIKERWYYRNGNYYCAKGCWQKSKKGKDKGEVKK